MLNEEELWRILKMYNMSDLVDDSPVSSTLSPQAIQQELNDNSWDYMTELVVIALIGALTFPANVFMLTFYARKGIRNRRQKRSLAARESPVSNSFNAYMIEICSFDTIIVAYLIVNTLFSFMYYLKKSRYESVFDVSNFTCKFFIYVLRISGAMSNYLVVLLSLDRCLLLIWRHEPDPDASFRVCFNSKYLSIFLLCICTIANVFRLELLNLNQKPPQTNSSSNPIIALLHKEMRNLTQGKLSECGPSAVSFSLGDKTDALLWSMIIYNIIFSIIPSVLSLTLFIYIRHRQSALMKRIDFICELMSHRKRADDNNDTQYFCDEAVESEPKWLLQLSNIDDKRRRVLNNFCLTRSEVEFLKTCTPCMAFSLAHFFLIFPYSLMETINQYRPNLTFIFVLQYMTYVRYLFYCCKFYLLVIVSFRFRCEIGLSSIESRDNRTNL
nr:G protein-coupled receptor [Proales similis]